MFIIWTLILGLVCFLVCLLILFIDYKIRKDFYKEAGVSFFDYIRDVESEELEEFLNLNRREIEVMEGNLEYKD
jgi:hypothetical protein